MMLNADRTTIHLTEPGADTADAAAAAARLRSIAGTPPPVDASAIGGGGRWAGRPVPASVVEQQTEWTAKQPRRPSDPAVEYAVNPHFRPAGSPMPKRSPRSGASTPRCAGRAWT